MTNKHEEPPADSKKRQLIVMAGLMLALGAAMAIGTRGEGGRRGGFERTDEEEAPADVERQAERPTRAPSEDGPGEEGSGEDGPNMDGPIKGEGADRGSRAGEQSVDGPRQGPDAEADREEAAARSAHEDKIERTRRAIDEARRQGRSADAERLQQRLDDLEARPPSGP